MQSSLFCSLSALSSYVPLRVKDESMTWQLQEKNQYSLYFVLIHCEESLSAIAKTEKGQSKFIFLF